MPSIKRHFIDAKHLLGCCGRKGIQPLAAGPFNQSVLRVPILYKKEVWVKLKKNIIIGCEAMN
jgi:hypothetical protein